MGGHSAHVSRKEGLQPREQKERRGINDATIKMLGRWKSNAYQALHYDPSQSAGSGLNRWRVKQSVRNSNATMFIVFVPPKYELR